MQVQQQERSRRNIVQLSISQRNKFIRAIEIFVSGFGKVSRERALVLAGKPVRKSTVDVIMRRTAVTRISRDEFERLAALLGIDITGWDTLPE